HVHLVVIPQKPHALAVAFKQTHGRYASYWNASHRSSGHAWQGRFYSCPLDTTHLWEALRYAERNPVRAGLVSKPEEWPWSSAAAHCGIADPDACLTMEPWSAQWTIARWRDFLSQGETESQLSAIRQATHTGRPLGHRSSSKHWKRGCIGACRRRKAAVPKIQLSIKGRVLSILSSSLNDSKERKTFRLFPVFQTNMSPTHSGKRLNLR